RLHAAAHLDRHCGQSRALQEPALRSIDRLRADLRTGRRAERAVRARRFRHQVDRRSRRARQGRTRRAQLFEPRRGHEVASHGRAAQAARRHRYGAHPIPGRRSRDHGGAGRDRRAWVGRARAGRAANQGREVHGARGDRSGALVFAAGRADHDRVRLPRLRLGYVQRAVCTRRNSARDHCSFVERHQGGAEVARSARAGAPCRVSNRRRDARRTRRASCVGNSGGQRIGRAIGNQAGGEMRMYCFASAAVICAAVPALPPRKAHASPSKPIHFILPYVPGGIIDTAGRHLALRLSESLGQSVVPENRPGAGGMVGADVVARSAPDGYTMLLTDPGLVSNPTLQADVPYDLFKGLQGVSIVGSSPAVIVASLKLPVNTLPELIAYAKDNPGKLNFASAGIGTAPHLAGEMVKLRTGIDMTHVPYRGIGAAYPDVMSGKGQLAFSSMAGAVPFTSDNRVRPLATTSLARSPVYPDVPTVAESLPGFDVDLWIGIYAPAGLPPPVLDRLNGEINKVLQHPDLKAAFANIGVEPRGTRPEEAASFTRSEYEKW